MHLKNPSDSNGIRTHDLCDAPAQGLSVAASIGCIVLAISPALIGAIGASTGKTVSLNPGLSVDMQMTQ